MPRLQVTMYRILMKRRNFCTLVVLICFCQVYINFLLIRSFVQKTVVIVEGGRDGRDHVQFTVSDDIIKIVKMRKQRLRNEVQQLLQMKGKPWKHKSEVSEIYQRRRHQVESTCSAEVRGNVKRVITYNYTSYCVTHKIGSTFWLRIFRYLFNDTRKGHVNSPFDISKYETHLSKYKRLKEVPLNTKTQNKIANSFRYMFVREPFARLWSVYVDKFILPDNFFWTIHGKKIKALKRGKYKPTKEDRENIIIKPKKTKSVQLRDKNLRKSKSPRRPQTSPVRTKRSNVFPRSGVCDPVSFLDFLKYIVNIGLNDGSKLDDHFRPVHFGCNPCKFQPDVIGKLESMADDSRYILTRLGLSWVADIHSRDERVKDEISMLIDFNYELVVKRKFLARCVSIRALAQKLWKTFQINGYIPQGINIDLTDFELQKKQNFLKFVWDTYKKANRSSEEMKWQRRHHLLNAYKGVPLEVLRGIQRVFRRDFELFDYDPQPADIFNHRVTS